MVKHKLIREFESQVSDMKVQVKDKELIID